MHRLWCGDGGVGVAHRCGNDHAALEDQAGLGAEEGGFPQHQVGQFADLDRAHFVSDAMGDGRVNSVFGDATLDTEVIMLGRVTA